MSGGRSGVLII